MVQQTWNSLKSAPSNLSLKGEKRVHCSKKQPQNEMQKILQNQNSNITLAVVNHIPI